MTKKQYRGKMIQLQRNLNKIGKANGLPITKTADRVGIPNWGTIIACGKHEGEILKSYAQAWDIISEFLKETSAFEGIS